MSRTFASLAILAAMSSAAFAGPMSADRRATPPRSQYVVSANLNKLVFWHVPSRDEAPASRR